MNKEELVRAVSSQVDLNQDKVTRTINVILQEITQALSKGDKMIFIGFGTFTVAKRSARNGRNPRTGVPVQIPERNVAKFTAGKELREAVNSK
jgi:DNA-binding protein HU-beta